MGLTTVRINRVCENIAADEMAPFFKVTGADSDLDQGPTVFHGPSISNILLASTIQSSWAIINGCISGI